MGFSLINTSNKRIFPIIQEQGNAAVNTALTVTLPAAGAGLYHYITSIRLDKLYNVVGVASGAGIIVTTTNLNGLEFITQQIGSAAGTVAAAINVSYGDGLRSAVPNTDTTITAPAQLQTIWYLTVNYYIAPLQI